MGIDGEDVRRAQTQYFFSELPMDIDKVTSDGDDDGLRLSPQLSSEDFFHHCKKDTLYHTTLEREKDSPRRDFGVATMMLTSLINVSGEEKRSSN